MTKIGKIKDFDTLIEINNELMDAVPFGVLKQMAGSVAEIRGEKAIFVSDNGTEYELPEDAYEILKRKYKTLSEIMEDYEPIQIMIGTTYSIQHNGLEWEKILDDKIILGKVSFTEKDANAILENLNGAK